MPPKLQNSLIRFPRRSAGGVGNRQATRSLNTEPGGSNCPSDQIKNSARNDQNQEDSNGAQLERGKFDLPFTRRVRPVVSNRLTPGSQRFSSNQGRMN
jgi:hypothetical protein